MTDIDIIDAAARLGYTFEVALAAIVMCTDTDEREHYAARGFRTLFAAAESRCADIAAIEFSVGAAIEFSVGAD